MQIKRQGITAILTLLCLWFAARCLGQSLTFWHPWPQGRRTVAQLASEYTRRTGVRITVTSFSPQGYVPWRGGSQPDIIGLSYPTRATIVSNARAGRLYNMQSEIQLGWYADLWPAPLEVFALRGVQAPAGRRGIYGVPLTSWVKVFIYNPRIFRRLDVQPPQTWSQFLLTSQRLRRPDGILPLAGGFDGNNPGFPLMYEWSYLGSTLLLETYFGRYPYTAQQWQNLMRIYPEIQQYGLTTYSASQMSRIDAERYFLTGRTAMILDGPWFETTRRGNAPSFRDWQVFGPPQDWRSPYLARPPGGVAEGAVINARSRNSTSAARFLRWLTEPAQQVRLANAMSSIPISQRASYSPELASHLKRFVPYMSNSAIDLRYYESPTVLSTYYSGVRGIIRGTSTSSTVLQRTQEVAR